VKYDTTNGERRRVWTEADRQRIQEYAREWMNRDPVERIREEHHDRCSRTIRPQSKNSRPQKLVTSSRAGNDKLDKPLRIAS
jgi:hypothetical protein